MTRAFGLRLVLTLLALGCALSAALTVFGVIPGVHFPAHLVHINADRYRVEPSSGHRLPTGLQRADVIALAPHLGTSGNGLGTARLRGSVRHRRP